MNTASEGQWQEWDDSAEDAPERRDAGSRRLLLSGAAGGLAMAASGLLLPDWLVEEAAADNHPVRRIQGRKEQKRQKRRNQDKQRTHGDKKDKLRGNEPWVPRIAIGVHNYRNTAVRLRGWQVTGKQDAGQDTWEMPTVWNWRELPGWTSNQRDQHSHTEFVSARDHIAVQIVGNGDPFAVEAKISYDGNGSPMKGYMDATIWRLGDWGSYGDNNSVPLKSDTRMWINSGFNSGGYGIVVKNVGIADSGHAVLSVDLDQV